MVDFATFALPLIDAEIKVVAGSVDSVESVQALRAGLHVGFPMWGELDAATVSADTGMSLVPTISGNETAVVEGGGQAVVNLIVDSSLYAVGTYEGAVTLSVVPEDSDFPAEYALHLAVADNLKRVYLPVIPGE